MIEIVKESPWPDLELQARVIERLERFEHRRRFLRLVEIWRAIVEHDRLAASFAPTFQLYRKARP